MPDTLLPKPDAPTVLTALPANKSKPALSNKTKLALVFTFVILVIASVTLGAVVTRNNNAQNATNNYQPLPQPTAATTQDDANKSTADEFKDWKTLSYTFKLPIRDNGILRIPEQLMSVTVSALVPPAALLGTQPDSFKTSEYSLIVGIPYENFPVNSKDISNQLSKINSSEFKNLGRFFHINGYVYATNIDLIVKCLDLSSTCMSTNAELLNPSPIAKYFGIVCNVNDLNTTKTETYLKECDKIVSTLKIDVKEDPVAITETYPFASPATLTKSRPGGDIAYPVEMQQLKASELSTLDCKPSTKMNGIWVDANDRVTQLNSETGLDFVTAAEQSAKQMYDATLTYSINCAIPDQGLGSQYYVSILYETPTGAKRSFVVSAIQGYTLAKIDASCDRILAYKKGNDPYVGTMAGVAYLNCITSGDNKIELSVQKFSRADGSVVQIFKEQIQ